MNMKKCTLVAAACAALIAVPVSGQAMDFTSGSDRAFDQMLGSMAATDTGSGWFEYYVEVTNQEIALRDSTDAYGAAGPGGPLDGFEGYISGFRIPDTGSAWFNDYVDAVNHVISDKQSY